VTTLRLPGWLPGRFSEACAYAVTCGLTVIARWQLGIPQHGSRIIPGRPSACRGTPGDKVSGLANVSAGAPMAVPWRPRPSRHVPPCWLPLWLSGPSTSPAATYAPSGTLRGHRAGTRLASRYIPLVGVGRRWLALGSYGPAADWTRTGGAEVSDALPDRMERWYGAWCDSPGYLDECDEHGSQRAAFFAGVHAGALEIRRLEATADPDCQECGFRLPNHDRRCSSYKP
jgi:hypothetical protein